MLWDALQSETEEQKNPVEELPVLPDLTDHPYYQQFNTTEEEED